MVVVGSGGRIMVVEWSISRAESLNNVSSVYIGEGFLW